MADAQGYSWSISSLFRCFAKTGEEVNRVEIGAALILSCGDRAGAVDGTALEPRRRKTPEDCHRRLCSTVKDGEEISAAWASDQAVSGRCFSS